MTTTSTGFHFILPLLSVLLFLHQANANLTALPTNFSPTNKSTTIAQKREYLLGLVNQVRRKVSVGNLYLDTTLNQLAQAHSQDMLKRNFFDHVNPQGLTPQNRSTKIGFLYGVGQNIAYDTRFNLTQLHVNLMNSRPHYQNTIKPDWTRVGFGIAFNNTRTYLTVVFSSRDFIKFPLTQTQRNSLMTALRSNIEASNKFTTKPAFWPELSTQLNIYLNLNTLPNLFTYLSSKNYRYLSISSRSASRTWSLRLADDVKNSFAGVSKDPSPFGRYGIGIKENNTTGMVNISVVYITPR